MLILIPFSSYANSAAEPATVDEVLDTLQNLTCETEGVGNLLRTEFSHTCIRAPFFSFQVANLLSPDLYANTFLRVNLNSDDISITKDACKRENRVDYYDQKLSFTMCNNIKLAAERAAGLGEALIGFIEGGNSFEGVVNSWNVPKSKYHDFFVDKRVDEQGEMYDVGIIPVFPWKIISIKDRLCVATTAFGGWGPIGCKYIKEPYPVSIYANFISINSDEDTSSLTSCSGTGDCYRRAHDNSKTAIVMTGPLIECIKEMITKLLISNSVCKFEDIEAIATSSDRESSALYGFQQNMHKTVVALLTIYVILFGFKVILSGDIPPKSEVIIFVIKFLFVVYFSIGLNISTSSANNDYKLDGMVQWAFPFLLNGMNQMSEWVINASPSGLCDFSTENYDPSLKHLELWDSLDCRLSHYLGLDMIQTMVAENLVRERNWEDGDLLSFPIPPYLLLLIPAIYLGNFTLISLALMYPLLVISVAAFVVNMTVVCMIGILILGVLAPLFVPLYLFSHTKPYFESWMKLLISFMIQPMVAVVFMTVMLSVYDFGFYGTCKYLSTNSAINVDPTAAVRFDQPLLDSIENRTVKFFYVDQDWEGSYGGRETDEARGCRESLGYILNNPVQFLVSFSKSVASEVSQEGDSLLVKKSPGIFFDSIEIIAERIKSFVISILIACFILYLMKQFSESLAEFAADMTEGATVSSASIKPTSLYNSGMNAINSASKGANSKQGGGNSSGSGDMISRGGGSSSGSGDMISRGGGKSSGSGDMISRGGGNAGGKSNIPTGGSGGS